MPTDDPPLAARPLERGFAGGWKIQRRVIHALFMREILTRYGRHNIGFLWLFVEPMLFTLVITFFWIQIRASAFSNLNIAAFALTGYSAALLWRTTSSRCIGAIESNRSLLHHRPVKIEDVLFARILLEIGALTVSFTTLVVVLWMTGLSPLPEDYVKLAIGWGLMIFFSIGLALTIAVLTEKYQTVQKLWPPLSYILFFTSGMAFLADALPPAAREIALWVPMLSATEYIRDGYFGSVFTAHYDLYYLLAWCLGLTLFGLSQIKTVGLARADG